MTVGYDARFSHGDFGVWVAAGPGSRRRRPPTSCASTEPWRCAVSARSSCATRLAPRSLRSALASLLLGACSWFTDFKEQPKIDPWESPNDTIPLRGNPQNSVPIYGTRRAGLRVSSRAACRRRSTRWRRSRIRCRPTRARCINGRMYYQINCAVCHGDAGEGRWPDRREVRHVPADPLVGRRRTPRHAPTATSGA